MQTEPVMQDIRYGNHKSFCSLWSKPAPVWITAHQEQLMEPSHISIRPFCSQNSSPINFGRVAGPCLRHCLVLQITQPDPALLTDYQCNQNGRCSKVTTEPHLAFSKPSSLEWAFPGILLSHSCGSSKSQPLWLSLRKPGLWAPKIGGKLGNWEISTRLADTNYIFLTQSWRGRCSPVLWAVSAALHITLPPIRMAFNPWLPPARENEMVRNLLGFIIMHNNLLYITT